MHGKIAEAIDLLIQHGSPELSLPLQASVATSQFADALASHSKGVLKMFSLWWCLTSCFLVCHYWMCRIAFVSSLSDKFCEMYFSKGNWLIVIFNTAVLVNNVFYLPSCVYCSIWGIVLKDKLYTFAHLKSPFLQLIFRISLFTDNWLTVPAITEKEYYQYHCLFCFCLYQLPTAWYTWSPFVSSTHYSLWPWCDDAYETGVDAWPLPPIDPPTPAEGKIYYQKVCDVKEEAKETYMGVAPPPPYVLLYTPFS